MRKLFTMVAGTLAASAMTLVALPGAASAASWPSGCRYNVEYGMAHAYCSGGGGYYRAVAACYNPGQGTWVFAEPTTWVRPGHHSYKSCPGGTLLRYAGINQKAG
ncbi:hypothetical protein ACFQ73_09585 [Amycolatopsis japonica]|uniref:hypothetical protein n=1 Tax=Amycolatopsis japonica TaxID=208439 RepID=UPI0033336C01